MRAPRALALAGATLVLGAAACDETRAPITAEINGSHDLVRVGDLVFVTATDANELRVIDAQADDFVRAPNPLHPLSIPVVDRPVALARDVEWTAQEASGGAYVYALSANGRELSIVGAAPDSLIELGTWSTDRDAATRGQTLTAAAAQRKSVPADSPPEPSTLFVATFDGFDATIRSMSIQPSLPRGSKLAGGTVVTQLSCASITSMLVLPLGWLAWSSRPTPCRDGSTPAPPRSEMLEVQFGGSVPLAFPPGIGVRKLFTHDAAGTRSAAEHIFGILDDRSCGGSPVCRGIFAVTGPNKPAKPPGSACDAVLGGVACDFSGAPMLPILGERSLIMDASVIPGVRPQIPEKELGDPATSLIGVYTTSDGRMVFFDAERLRHFDINELDARLVTSAVRGPGGELLTGQGAVVDKVTPANGAARTEVITFTFLGDLPRFSRLTLDTNSQQFDVNGFDPAPIVAVGDVAYEQPAAAGGSGCARTATVTGVAGATISLDGPVGSPECTVSVRPPDATTTPWVVVGSSSGFLGRIAPSTRPTPEGELQPVSVPADLAQRRARFFNRPIQPVAYNDANPQAYLTLVFETPSSLAPLDPSAHRGARVEMSIDAAFQVAETAASSSVNTHVAGGIAFRSTDEGKKGQLFIAYPSGDEVLEFELTSLEPGAVAIPAQPFRR